MQDLLQMQQCNLFNLPENYNMRYWMYHIMSWTHLPHVAVDESSGKIVGYVLAKMEEETTTKDFIPHGHITSISVLRDYRKLGIATRLMRAAHTAMSQIYGAKYCSLHVRESNRAALGMYKDVLKYVIIDREYEYYADKEHAYDMVLFFDKSVQEKVTIDKQKEHAKKKAEKLKKQKEDEQKEESKDDTASTAAVESESASEADKKKKKKNKKKK